MSIDLYHDGIEVLPWIAGYQVGTYSQSKQATNLLLTSNSQNGSYSYATYVSGAITIPAAGPSDSRWINVLFDFDSKVVPGSNSNAFQMWLGTVQADSNFSSRVTTNASGKNIILSLDTTSVAGGTMYVKIMTTVFDFNLINSATAKVKRVWLSNSRQDILKNPDSGKKIVTMPQAIESFMGR